MSHIWDTIRQRVYTLLLCRTCNHRARRGHLDAGRCPTAFTPSEIDRVVTIRDRHDT